MLEKFVDIKGYEGYYQISNHGRIKSLKRIVKHASGDVELKEKFKKPTVNSNGYYKTNLYKNGKETTVYIHRLIASAFIPNLDNKPQINHIDGVKTNNDLSNLEWVTQSENGLHAYNIGLRNVVSHSSSDPRFKTNVKLTKKQVLEIRKLKNNISTRKIAKMFNTSHVTVSMIRTGRIWSDVC